MKKINGFSISKKSLYILGAIALGLYLFMTIFLTYGYFDLLKDVGKENAQVGFALVFVIVVILMGSGGYLASFGFALAGLIVSIVKRKRHGLDMKWVVPFIVLTVLPILTEIFMILLYNQLR